MELPLWQPSAQRIADANMTAFQQYLQQKYAFELGNYQQLHWWSVEHLAEFWQALWDYCQIIASNKAREVLQNGDQMPGAQWFAGAKLNFAENLLRYQDDSLALIAVNERGQRRTYSYAQLRKQVALFADFLRAQGVGPGDRVAGLLPNCAETVIAMLACSSLGAVWSSCSPDFGAQAMLDRFGQIAPKILIAVDAYTFKGKVINMMETLHVTLRPLMTTVKKLVVIPYVQTELPQHWHTLAADDFVISWQQALDRPMRSLQFYAADFNHPLYIMFSSGTTGKPKCIVHGAGGTLLQHLKELVLHGDLKKGSVLFYYTTCGWMMWNWMVSGLAVGATLVLYEGAAMYPQADSLFAIIEKEKVTHFGTSSKYVSALAKAEMRPKKHYNLQHLQVLFSTGSPLLAQSFDYLYQQVKADLCVSSISGGTDIVSCFALGNPTIPVYKGQLQCPGLAMDLQFYNEQGKAVVGEKGELVCRKPFPSMPLGFWQDETGSQYLQAYFCKYPGVWSHGDFGEFTAQGGIIIHGRSDAVLNPGGVRIGTAEIYRQVEKCDQVLESLAVGQQWQGDQRVILFVVLRENIALSAELIETIRQTIRVGATPRHIPAKIIAVTDLPRTINGKLSELAVNRVIHGEEVKNKEALANPQCLRLFAQLDDLRN